MLTNPVPQISKAEVSERLSSSPCALVSSRFGWTANMERIVTSQTHSKANDVQREWVIDWRGDQLLTGGGTSYWLEGGPVIDWRGDQLLIGGGPVIDWRGDQLLTGEEEGDQLLIGEEEGDQLLIGEEEGDQLLIGEEEGGQLLIGEEEGGQLLIGEEEGDQFDWLYQKYLS